MEVDCQAPLVRSGKQWLWCTSLARPRCRRCCECGVGRAVRVGNRLQGCLQCKVLQSKRSRPAPNSLSEDVCLDRMCLLFATTVASSPLPTNPVHLHCSLALRHSGVCHRRCDFVTLRGYPSEKSSVTKTAVFVTPSVTKGPSWCNEKTLVGNRGAKPRSEMQMAGVRLIPRTLRI